MWGQKENILEHERILLTVNFKNRVKNICQQNINRNEASIQHGNKKKMGLNLEYYKKKCQNEKCASTLENIATGFFV